jgi:hypothetical protein
MAASRSPGDELTASSGEAHELAQPSCGREAIDDILRVRALSSERLTRADGFSETFEKVATCVR